MTPIDTFIPLTAQADPIMTFVVPIYNAARDLRACLDSILERNITKELILINDGSTDDSLAIAREYEQAHPFVRVIDQENHGVSYARNLGIKLARGRYICFVDADDIVLEQDFATLIDTCDREQIDMYKSAIRCFHDDDIDGAYVLEKNIAIAVGQQGEYATILSGQEYFRRSVYGYWYPVTWNGFYRTDFLRDNDLYFPLGFNNGEDIYFSIMTFLAHPRVLATGEGREFMLHRLRANSLSTRGGLTTIEHHAGIVKLLEDKVADLSAEMSQYVANDYEVAYSDRLAELVPLSQYIQRAIAFLHWISFEFIYCRLDDEGRAAGAKYFPDDVIELVRQQIGHEIIRW